jgi:coenzyme F420 hydrogenase subunit beta
VTTIEEVCAAGLCTQCGTCAALCPTATVSASWNVRDGYIMSVDKRRCTDCGLCVEVCPGPGCDFTADAWWRAENEGAPSTDFLGPWRRLFTGWATDERTRYLGASGGFATAIVQGALEAGVIDAALLCDSDPERPLRARPIVARTADEVAACRGSKYNAVATNLMLREVLDRPGRYALVGLPCHIQGFRQARERSRRLRERVVFTTGIFCGWTATPRATLVEALRAGLDPAHLARVSYRGPGWPGCLRFETQDGTVREAAFPAYFYRLVRSYTLPRCRLCPDGLAELADISVGDAWLPQYHGTPGASDLIVRTPIGERLVERIAGEWLTLFPSTPDEILRSQSETKREKRSLYRGRLRLRALSGRSVPENPGITSHPDPADTWAGVRDLLREVHRSLEALRFPPRA